MQKAKIDGKIYEVTTFEQYTKNPESYNTLYTAIKMDDKVLPIRNKNDDRPGVYLGSGISFIKQPTPQDIDEYNTDNIIDFNNITSIKEVMDKQKQIRTMEKEILTNPNNIFTPRVDPNDAPEMRALKEAVLAKHIDLDKYESRFGVHYNNDKRLFKKSTISLGKLRTMFDALDIKSTLIIEDKSEDVPNPIGKKIVIELTEGGGSDNESETE